MEIFKFSGGMIHITQIRRSIFANLFLFLRNFSALSIRFPPLNVYGTGGCLNVCSRACTCSSANQESRKDLNSVHCMYCDKCCKKRLLLCVVVSHQRCVCLRRRNISVLPGQDGPGHCPIRRKQVVVGVAITRNCITLIMYTSRAHDVHMMHTWRAHDAQSSALQQSSRHNHSGIGTAGRVSHLYVWYITVTTCLVQYRYDITIMTCPILCSKRRWMFTLKMTFSFISMTLHT